MGGCQEIQSMSGDETPESTKRRGGKGIPASRPKVGKVADEGGSDADGDDESSSNSGDYKDNSDHTESSEDPTPEHRKFAEVLTNAVKRNKAEEVQLLLKERLGPLAVNVRNSQGHTPLYEAASRNALEIVITLLNYPTIDVNAYNTKHNTTALQVATKKGHVEVAALLLTMDATINQNRRLDIKANMLKMNVLYIKYDEGGCSLLLKDYPCTQRLNIVKSKMHRKQQDWDELAFECEGRARIVEIDGDTPNGQQQGKKVSSGGKNEKNEKNSKKSETGNGTIGKSGGKGTIGKNAAKRAEKDLGSGKASIGRSGARKRDDSTSAIGTGKESIGKGKSASLAVPSCNDSVGRAGLAKRSWGKSGDFATQQSAEESSGEGKEQGGVRKSRSSSASKPKNEDDAMSFSNSEQLETIGSSGKRKLVRLNSLKSLGKK